MMLHDIGLGLFGYVFGTLVQMWFPSTSPSAVLIGAGIVYGVWWIILQ